MATIKKSKSRKPSRRTQLKNVTIDFVRKHGMASLLRPLTTQQRMLLLLRLNQIVGKNDISTALSAEDVRELPILFRRDLLACDAMKENTFSGALRRAVQFGRFTLPDLAQHAKVNMNDIEDFLCGEKALPSDAIDRLIRVLKLKLPTSS
jgi:hypothetical protein